MSTFQRRERTGVATLSDDHDLPFTGEKLWSDLDQMDMEQMIRLATTVERMAPGPGFLVYVETSRLSCLLHKLEPVVFSAFDANTHLQIARIYLTNTLASALDFTEFILKRFPFPIAQIRTLAETPFYIRIKPPTQQRFSNHLAMRGVLHSLMTDRSWDQLFSMLSKFSFSSFSTGSPMSIPAEKLTSEFSNFLFYHNNRRMLSSLQGRTPLQKLRSFKGFDQLSSFDPLPV